MRFLDWMGVLQVHHEGGLPIVCEEHVTRERPATGEVSVSHTKKRHVGSYSSSVEVKCDGFRVTIDGYASRYGGPDNLFGFETFDECISVYNGILSSYDLPPFTKCTKTWYRQGKDGSKARKLSNGAIFQRIDFTRNLLVGKDNVQAFLRALSSQTIGKGFMPHLYPNGQTLDWTNGSQDNQGGKKVSSLWYQKLYNKAHDLGLTLNKRGNNLTEKERAHLIKLINYCDQYGVLRDEKEFKRDFLANKNLCFYGMVNETDFEPYLNEIDQMIERIEMNTSDHESVSDQLLELGICKSRHAANTTQSYCMSWQNGYSMQKKSAFYVHRKRLLQIGIDISVPHDVTRLAPQIKRQREILVSTMLPPPWYQMPKANHLSLVS